ncbi:hypothetical protein CAAN1_07S06656 [[Candida] anglica]|uniref:F-box domain-containing protein n=1 Tax=[Candida] anglica TaxID=148631 RepID=A0ABP0EG66_9ASCO
MTNHLDDESINELPISLGGTNPYNRARRRSSSFRPTFFYPATTNNGYGIDRVNKQAITKSNTNNSQVKDFESVIEDSIISLESLPVAILTQICSNLRTNDLLSVCRSSLYLYLPATIQLYNKIIVSSNPRAIQLARTQFSHSYLNFGTLILSDSLPKLCRVLMENPKLAAYVKTLILIGNINWDTHYMGTHAWSFDPSYSSVSAPLRAFLAPVLQLPRVQLNELYFPSWSLSQPNVHDFSRIQWLTVSLTGIKELHEKVILPRLTGLKILYENNSSQQIILENFAAIIFPSLTHLSTLQFEREEPDSSQFLLQTSVGNKTTPAIWISFLQVLRKLITQKLKISRLSLDGFLGNTGNVVASILGEVTDLHLLNSLQLHTRELTHQFEPHSVHVSSRTSFLRNLTMKTTSLMQLSITPTHDCLFCQNESIKITLSEILPNQLVTLSIVLDSPNLLYTQNINHAINTHQRKLINLKYHDKSQEVSIRKALGKFLPSAQVDLYDRASLSDSILQTTIYRNFFLYDIESISTRKHAASRRNSVVLNDYMVKFIMENHNQLAEFLWYDGPEDIVIKEFDFVRHLPKLQYLCMFGINLYIKNSDPRRVQFITNDGYEYIDAYEQAVQ